MTLGRRLTRLEERQAAGATRPVEEPWWARVPAPVADYRLAQEPAIAEAFGAHLDAMQDLPGNRDGFAYYQVLTRPWRPGERHFLLPVLRLLPVRLPGSSRPGGGLGGARGDQPGHPGGHGLRRGGDDAAGPR